MKRAWVQWTAVIITVLVGVGAVATMTTPQFWAKWGVTAAGGVTALATVVLVLATIGNVRQTRELARQSALQGRILERQGMLATLPAMVLESHGRSGRVRIKNKAQPPALNVEYRYLTELDNEVRAPVAWEWIDAVMAKSADKPADRPTSGTIHAQVRFLDSLGTLYLVERRWLGAGAWNAYRLFRRSENSWEHLTFYRSDQQPLLAESAVPTD